MTTLLRTGILMELPYFVRYRLDFFTSTEKLQAFNKFSFHSNKITKNKYI
jgi:hypothetical protein